MKFQTGPAYLMGASSFLRWIAALIFTFYNLASVSAADTTNQAASERDAKIAPAPPIVASHAEVNGMKVVREFDAEGGLTGFVLSNRPGNNVLAFSPKGNQDVLLIGTLLDRSGISLNEKYIEKYGTKLDLDKFKDALERAPSVFEGADGGSAKSKIYVFLDPNCIFCHLLWKALQPYEKAGLQVQWIPIGFLKNDSAGKAAALLDSKEKSQALYAMESNFSEKNESGGIEPEEVISPATQSELDENRKLFSAMGFQGTPAVVFFDSTKRIRAKQGMPRMSLLPYMLSMAPQEMNDAALQRFK
ncbi:thiol:disulfide interchange protein DsbG [Burkholderia plantarii]|uniref:thiol:disulfide interchange protein DsbG n=1 Tax=Burkholderia plantarii TaxID=41899 RepID=UPI000706081F|nr:thiol:disulfide interchange protein DsbG [Burkholderia plantarii]ALK34189.1 Disulfide isomerase/thiol-disulfide oxidase [Burkholderia plantarii]GLZ20685.1 hypothetical protein Bpla01_42140 [Burkholderia plantarii]